MDTHKRILGILFIISGVFQLIGFLIVSVFFSTFFPFIIEEARGEGVWVLEWIQHFGQIIGYTLIIFSAIPCLIAGAGLLNKQRWALVLALILGCFKLFSFPIGTAIGVYAIWVYIEDQKQIKTN
jgi:hypothetical protein